MVFVDVVTNCSIFVEMKIETSGEKRIKCSALFSHVKVVGSIGDERVTGLHILLHGTDLVG